MGTGTAPAGGSGPAAGRPDESLGRSRRLTRAAQFREAYAQGRRWVGRRMVLWLREGEGASLRVGVVTGRKVGNAVARARARRLLREAYRRNRASFSGAVDVVLVARRSLLEAKWDAINEELRSLAGQAGLMKGPDG